jgi:hypothetical protein
VHATIAERAQAAVTNCYPALLCADLANKCRKCDEEASPYDSTFRANASAHTRMFRPAGSTTVWGTCVHAKNRAALARQLASWVT